MPLRLCLVISTKYVIVIIDHIYVFETTHGRHQHLFSVIVIHLGTRYISHGKPDSYPFFKLKFSFSLKALRISESPIDLVAFSAESVMPKSSKVHKYRISFFVKHSRVVIVFVMEL